MKIKEEDWEEAARALIQLVSDDWKRISAGSLITLRETTLFVPFSQAEKAARERRSRERLVAEANREGGLK